MAARKLPLTTIRNLFFLLLVAGQTNARAEGFAELYLGTAGNWRADVAVSETRSSGTTSASTTAPLPSPAEFGLRFGAWHPTYDHVGVGIDFGYAHIDAPGVEITTFPMSILLALRAPLFPTPDRPHGRLQPYAMGGVSFYIADVSIRLNGMGGDSYQGGWPMPFASNTGNKVFGPYLAAGLAWQPTKRFAIFGEYRYTSFDVEYDTTNSFLFPTVNGRVDATFRAERILFGISHRFGSASPGMGANR